jgi:acyl carrier protein
LDTATSITEYVRDELLVGDGELNADTPLWDGAIDSVALIQLISFIEDRFGVEIDDAELTSDHFNTVADIAALVDRKLASA